MTKLFLLLSTVSIVSLFGNTGYSQNVSLNLTFKSASSLDLINEIKAQTGFDVSYDLALENFNITDVEVYVKDEKIENALKEVFKNTEIEFRVVDKIILLTRRNDPELKGYIPLIEVPVLEVAQTFKVTGNVIDAGTNEPMIGVNVVVEGSTLGTTTDVNGNYSLNLPSENVTLAFSFIGYLTEKVQLAGRNTVDVRMMPDIASLQEVVVVGYGSQKKESVTAAITNISAKELVQSPTANISNSLSGRLSGLISIQGSGKPGDDASSLYVRGLGTYSSDVKPLIMVDGVERESYNNIDANEIESLSILKDASATAVYGVRGANGVILITTKRGKAGQPKVSMSAQTAWTKFTRMPEFVNAYEYASLQNERTFLSYWKDHAKDPDIATWADFIAKRDANWKTSGWYFSDQDLLKYQNAHKPLLENGQSNPNYDPYMYPDSDWKKLLFNDYARQSQYNINIDGGTESVKYFVSLGYLNQGGLFKTDYMAFPDEKDYSNKRYNIRGNFDFDVNKNFKIAVDVGSQFENQSGMTEESWMWEKRIWWSNPLSSPGMIDGKFVMPYNNPMIDENPMHSIAGTNYNIKRKSTLTSSVKLSHKLDFITKGLSANARLAYDSYFETRSGGDYNPIWYKVSPNPSGNVMNPILSQIGEETPPSRFSDWYEYKWRKIYGEASLNYARSFGKHEVGALALYNAEKRFDPRLQFQLPHAYVGVVGRVTYAYDGRYLAEYNMGYNGSENFPEGLRFGFLPAYSLGWVASRESFFPENKIVTFLKIRGSIGKVGSDNIMVNGVAQRYLYLPDTWNYTGGYGWENGGYSFGTLNDRNYVQGAREGVVGNKNVTWETATKSNIGFETRMFNDQLSVTYDYFDEDRVDILSYKGSIPGIVQASLPPYNLGRVKNWGYEVEVNWKDMIGEFSYWVKGNLSHNKNKIIFRDEAITKGLEYQAQTGSPIDQNLMLVADGLYTSWNDFYELDNQGNPLLSNPVRSLNSKGQEYVDKDGNPVYVKDLGYSSAVLQPGEIKLVDVNEDGKIDDNDSKRTGKTRIPEYTFGASMGFSFKGFDFSVLFQGISGVARFMGNRPFVKTYSITEVGKNRFTIDRFNKGDQIDFPLAAYSSESPAAYNTYFLKDASYLRLKNLEVGYTLKPSFLKRVGIESARIYANGTNLYTWAPNLIWGDPENLGFTQYPITASYNLGININF